jgi:anti-sigma factor RsiW
MDCPLIEGHLVGYHLAALGDEERGEVEAHLLACRACLRTYLALKTHLDGGGASAPSEASRLRLRAAVQERFRPSALRRVARWMRRPVPLYKSVAVVALAVAAAVLGPAFYRAFDRDGVARNAERVDSARTVALSLNIY